MRTLWGERTTDAVDRADDLAAGLGSGKLADWVAGLSHGGMNGARGGGNGAALGLSNAIANPGPTSRSGPVRTYDIAQRHAGSWGWKVSGYLFTKSIAAGAFLIPALLSLFDEAAPVERLFRSGVPLALAFLALTGVLLVADLKRPERFLWVLLRPQWKSWLVRGAYIITAYGALLGGWFTFGGTPGGFFSTLGGILAAATAAYSGWLFGQAKGRDLWQSPLVPVHLLCQALVAGSAALLLCAPFELADLANVLAVALALDALLILAEMHGRHASEAAARAQKLMISGQRRWWLYCGSLAIGHFLAIVLVLTGEGPTRAVAACFALIGVLIYEHLWVDAPQRLPLA